MKRTLVAGAVLAVALAGQAAAQGIAWETDFDKALQKAEETGKPIFIDFFAVW